MIGRQAGEKLSIVVLSRHIFTSSIWKNQYKQKTIYESFQFVCVGSVTAVSLKLLHAVSTEPNDFRKSSGRTARAAYRRLHPCRREHNRRYN